MPFQLTFTGATGVKLPEGMSGCVETGIEIRSNFSIRENSWLWSGVASDMARPYLPARPVRPMRWI